MPDLAWRPRFVAGAYDWSATIPMRIWSRALVVTGGSDRATTWYGASYEVSRAYLLRITLRFLESEENDVVDVIDYLRTWPQTGTFYPNQLDTATSYEVDVDLPRKGDDIEAQPDLTYPEARELAVTLRNVAGTAWPLTWF